MVQRLPAHRMWLWYAATWSLVGALSWTTAAVYLVREVRLSPLQLVLAGTALEVTYFLSEVPTGVLADLYSRRLSLVVSALVCGVGMIVVGLAPGAAVVLLGMALWGFGWTFRSGAEDAWLADEVGAAGLASAYQRGAQAERVAGLVGIVGAVALAMAGLELPFLAAGSVACLLAVFIAVAMPEQGFTRPERRSGVAGSARAALATFSSGRRVVAARPVLLLLLAFTFVAGAWAEGWDRLWEAHLLLDVGLPPLLGLDDVAWFGVLAAGGLLLSLLVATPMVGRLERLAPSRVPALLVLLHAAMLFAAATFALAGSLWPAVAAFWATSVLRSLADAPYRTWLNSSITESATRSTVLSITNIFGSAGEWTGGPALGWVGSRFSVRAALLVGATVLAPAVALLGAASRRTLRSPAEIGSHRADS